MSYARGKNPNSLKTLKPMTSERAKELGFGIWMKGKNLAPATRAKISESCKGGNKTSFKLGIQNNPNGGFKIGHVPKSKGTGTKCKETQIIRSSLAYKHWRMAVFTRDDFTCQICWQHGGELNADHIKPFSSYPDLRLDINNGRTLCVECHKATPTFARRKVL